MENESHEFTLENGTQVKVTRAGNHHHDFALTDEDGTTRHFVIDDEEEFTTEKEEALDFDQLNALRRFWLETRNEE